MNARRFPGRMLASRVRRAATLTATLMAMLLGAACDGDSITDPRFEPEITNVPDSFELQATGITGITQTLSYTWQNSGTVANVDQSGTISAGTATLRVRDANAVLVYTGNLANTGSFTTNTGTPGAWTIQLVLDDVSGTLNFRLQAP